MVQRRGSKYSDKWVFLGLLGPAFGHSSRVVRDSMAKNKIIWMTLTKKFTLVCVQEYAGRVRSNSFKNLAKDVNAIEEHLHIFGTGTPRKPLNKEEVRTIHERLLRANTKDYGRYDPSPSLSKPPFKLIPN
ncbi:Protein CASPARIAN STRIP INTEGRITY FACTOR 1 [Glycine max]|nr:Protein CASPARIAN STRIP INTEGRITY FACTOR 1 [Glycine max]